MSLASSAARPAIHQPSGCIRMNPKRLFTVTNIVLGALFIFAVIQMGLYGVLNRRDDNPHQGPTLLRKGNRLTRPELEG